MRAATSDTPEQASFRAHCRAWLRDNVPARPSFPLPQGPLEIATREQLDYLCAWQRAAWAAGLVGCDYPEAYGGGGRRDCQRVANEEMSAAGAPFLPNIVGLGMAAPTILHHGTEQQKRELLPPLLAGDEIWCQGFSEPGAGSDLANVQTSARRAGDRWIIAGHKVWTTLAHFATWMILLCRSDTGHKYRGLTYFVVPIQAKIGAGVTVRPLVKMTGELGFNEVIFEELEVGDDMRLDEVGRGWTVAMTTLSHERGAGGLVTPRSDANAGADSPEARNASALIGLARTCTRAGRPAADDPLIRDDLVKLLIRERAFTQHQVRARIPALCDDPQRLPLQTKLLISELQQDVARLGCEIEGMAATAHRAGASAGASPDANPDVLGRGRWPLAYMNSFGFTIAAGSSEIQRNILGERVLGLAKSK